MRSVKLKARVFFLVLILLAAGNGYSDICTDIYFRTDAEASGSSVGKGFWSFFTGQWSNLKFDPHLLKEIKVTAIKDQGVDGYFNPKIQVCDYERNNCYHLYSETSCHKIYGTQTSGAGISTAIFIDWEGTGDGTFIREGKAQGLAWEWADGVTDEEQKRFAKSPKICACSQKAACMGNFFSYFSRIGKGENIFRPGEMEDVCDTCYQTKVKCAPIPLAPGPPPFCDQLAMSPPQVRIVPVTNNDNDYFDPKVKVIIGNLKGENGKIGKELDFPEKYGKENAKEPSKPIKDDKGNTYYFKTYKEKDKLCAEYYGTQEISKKNWQFSRCFPAPPAPEPEIVEIVKDPNGNPSNTLKIKMKMSEKTCTGQAHGSYSGDSCTFNVNTNTNDPTNIGHLSLKVKKPKIIVKMTDSSDNKSTIDAILEKILNQSKDEDFKILKKYGYVPDIQIGCVGSQDFYDLKDFNEEQLKKCGFDNNRQPKIEVQYKKNDKSKMLCLSGWKPEPEEFVIERDDKIIALKSMGARYAKYNTVYSKESNQLYYFPCNETVDLLAKPQSELDEIIFNKRGYISIPEDNKGRSHCPADKDNEVDGKQSCSNCKIVYKLVDNVERKGTCSDGDDGCICMNNEYNRSTQYVRKDKDENNKGKDEPFYLRILQKEQCGAVEPQEIPTKVNRTEVFYADKLCRFDLEDFKSELRRIIKKQREEKKQNWVSGKPTSYDFSGQDDYTDNLSKYDYIEIEAWGGGEAGHIKDKAHSQETRAGMPGDYIKAKLKIDPNYPIIRVQVTEGGGGQEEFLSNKDGGPTIIEMCNSHRQKCRPLIIVAGGGKYKEYGTGQDRNKYKNTIIHEKSLKLEEPTIITSTKSTIECSSNSSSKKPGAGGCIDKSNGSYSKGSPGAVSIKPMIIDESEINNAIEKMVQDPNETITIDDSLIKKLKIIDMIEAEIKKELSGVLNQN